MDKTSDKEVASATSSPADSTSSDQAETPAPTAAEIAAQKAVDRLAAIENARILLVGAGYRVVVPNASSVRSTVLKADPDEVKDYFTGTGLSRQEIADAVGVTSSVIATVQNVNGDRWSAERFARARVLIDDAVALKAKATAAQA